MSKTIKNVLMVFTLVCVIMLVVVVVELFRLNKNSSATEIKNTPPVNQQQSESETPAESSGETDSQGNTSSPSPESETPPVTETETTSYVTSATGKRYEMPLNEESTLVLYAEEELFKYSELGDGDMLFEYLDTSSSLLACMVFVPSSQSILSAGFLNNDIFAEDLTIKPMQQIGRSALLGDFVTITDEEGTHEAWVHLYATEDHGEMGIGFIMNYSDDAQRDAFYAILNSAQIV